LEIRAEAVWEGWVGSAVDLAEELVRIEGWRDGWDMGVVGIAW